MYEGNIRNIDLGVNMGASQVYAFLNVYDGTSNLIPSVGTYQYVNPWDVDTSSTEKWFTYSILVNPVNQYVADTNSVQQFEVVSTTANDATICFDGKAQQYSDPTDKRVIKVKLTNLPFY
jgi:hypothetical protein